MRCSRSAAAAAARCCSIACTRRSRSHTAGRCAGMPPPRRAAALPGLPARPSSAPLPVAEPRASAAELSKLRLLRVRGCSRPARAPPQAAQLLRASPQSPAAWPRAHPCCAPPAPATPACAARCAAPRLSICLSAAPRLAASLSACRRSSPRVSSCAVSSSMARVSASASFSACAKFRLELRQPALGLAQFALQRQRTFAGRLAARHRRAMEALAFRREEVSVRVAQAQAAARRLEFSAR